MDTLNTNSFLQSENAMTLWTAIIALATIAYVMVSAFLLRINYSTLQLTKKIVSITHRPFIAIESVECNLTSERIKYPPSMTIKLKNIGNLPAKDVFIVFNGKVNSSVVKMSFPENGRLSLFPNISESFKFEITDERFINSVLFPLDPNEIIFDIEYQGVTDQKYTTHYNYNYDLGTHGVGITDCRWT